MTDEQAERFVTAFERSASVFERLGQVIETLVTAVTIGGGDNDRDLRTINISIGSEGENFPVEVTGGLQFDGNVKVQR